MPIYMSLFLKDYVFNWEYSNWLIVDAYNPLLKINIFYTSWISLQKFWPVSFFFVLIKMVVLCKYNEHLGHISGKDGKQNTYPLPSATVKHYKNDTEELFVCF